MSNIVILAGSPRKDGNTEQLMTASAEYFSGISVQLKAVIDRLHTPMRNEFRIKKLGLILVGAAQLPELFDAVKVLIRGAREKGDLKEEDLNQAYLFGKSLE